LIFSDKRQAGMPQALFAPVPCHLHPLAQTTGAVGAYIC
jgi:hypothetical protein